MTTTIDGVKTLQIRNAKNGDFDLNLADETARNQIEDLNQDLGVQTARIDNLLTQGTPTEGNAELIDIRVGADGTIYPTAGDAVRTQIDDLKNSQYGGLTEEAKQALLACFAEVAWATPNGQSLYDALEEALASGTVYYSIIRSIGNATASNVKSKVAEGASYTDTISPMEGYEVRSVTCTMGGVAQSVTDNQDGTFTISIAEVTANVLVSAVTAEEGGAVYYTVTNSLTHVASSNSNTTIEELTGYTTNLTVDVGYELDSVTVTMGGVDITNTAYSNGTVTIASVTGNIVITAIAVVPTSNYLYDYPFNGLITSIGTADLGLHTYGGGTPNFVSADGETYLKVANANEVLIGSNSNANLFDGNFTISYYARTTSGTRTLFPLDFTNFVDSTTVGVKFTPTNYEDGYTYTGGRVSKATCGVRFTLKGTTGMSAHFITKDYANSLASSCSATYSLVSDNSWHHIVLQRSGSEIAFYIDKTKYWSVETDKQLYTATQIAIGGWFASSSAEVNNTIEIQGLGGIKNLIIDDSVIDINTL